MRHIALKYSMNDSHHNAMLHNNNLYNITLHNDIKHKGTTYRNTRITTKTCFKVRKDHARQKDSQHNDM